MPAEIRISALGVGVAIEFRQGEVADTVSALSRMWAGATDMTIDVETRLTAGISGAPSTGPSAGAFDVSGHDVGQLAAALSTRVTLAAIEQRKSDLIMLHACGIATGDGSVVAFVGPSGRGKTTLASSLAQSYGYVTDETVGIDAEGRVHPYRKPLSVVQPGQPHHAKLQIAPDDLNLLPLPGAPLRIRAIVLLDRRQGPLTEATAEPVEMVDAIVALVPEMSYLPELTRPLQRLASLIDSVGGVTRVTYSDAQSVGRLVPDLVGLGSQEIRWQAMKVADRDGALPGQYRRAEVLDSIRCGTRTVVLKGREIRVLDGIGPAIWDALAAPRSGEEIVREVVAAFGDPEGLDPVSAVDAALRDLSDAGMVEEV